MSSQRSSNVDEMVRVALAEESLLPKEKECWWAPYVVDFTVVCCVPPLARGASCPNAVVRVVANDDGVVPGRPDGGVAVGVAADDDGVVPRRPGGGVVDDGFFEDPAKWWDVTDGERGTATTVDELARVHAPRVANGERGAATAVDELAHAHAPSIADGERGAATALDELAHVHALGVADRERGTATAVVLVVELSRDCN